MKQPDKQRTPEELKAIETALCQVRDSTEKYLLKNVADAWAYVKAPPKKEGAAPTTIHRYFFDCLDKPFAANNPTAHARHLRGEKGPPNGCAPLPEVWPPFFRDKPIPLPREKATTDAKALETREVFGRWAVETVMSHYRRLIDEDGIAITLRRTSLSPLLATCFPDIRRKYIEQKAYLRFRWYFMDREDVRRLLEGALYCANPWQLKDIEEIEPPHVGNSPEAVRKDEQDTDKNEANASIEDEQDKKNESANPNIWGETDDCLDGHGRKSLFDDRDEAVQAYEDELAAEDEHTSDTARENSSLEALGIAEAKRAEELKARRILRHGSMVGQLWDARTGSYALGYAEIMAELAFADRLLATTVLKRPPSPSATQVEALMVTLLRNHASVWKALRRLAALKDVSATSLRVKKRNKKTKQNQVVADWDAIRDQLGSLVYAEREKGGNTVFTTRGKPKSAIDRLCVEVDGGIEPFAELGRFPSRNGPIEQGFRFKERRDAINSWITKRGIERAAKLARTFLENKAFDTQTDGAIPVIGTPFTFCPENATFRRAQADTNRTFENNVTVRSARETLFGEGEASQRTNVSKEGAAYGTFVDRVLTKWAGKQEVDNDDKSTIEERKQRFRESVTACAGGDKEHGLTSETLGEFFFCFSEYYPRYYASVVSLEEHLRAERELEELKEGKEANHGH